MNETQIKEFLKTVEEKWNKLSKEARNQFWEGTEGKFDKVTIPEAYELSKEWFDYENKLKEEQKMDNKEKSTNAEVIEKSKVPKDLAVIKKKEALLTRQEMPLSEMKELAQLLWQSNYFNDVGSMAQAFVKIKAGQELGFPAIYSLNNFVVLPGKPPGGNGQTAGALIKRSGYDYRIIEWTNDKCKVDFFGLRGEKIGTHTVTYDEVSKITMRTKFGDKKLVDKDNWRNYRKAMLFWRTLGQGGRFFCPDALAGMYLIDAEGEVFADTEKDISDNSDLSKFQVDSTNEKKSSPVETKPEPTRKEIMAPLVEKHGMKRIKEVIANCKIEGSVYDTTDEKFKEVIDTLNTLGKISDKFKKEKESEKKETEMTIDEKRKEIKKLKKDFGEDKIKEIKHTMKIEGKLVELDEKTFKKFVKRVKSK
jgi:hypothetical protein